MSFFPFQQGFATHLQGKVVSGEGFQVAYGNGDRNAANKGVVLARWRLGKDSPLAELRLRELAALERFSKAAWSDGDPFAALQGSARDAVLLKEQATFKGPGGLNSKWAEKARLKASGAVDEGFRRKRAKFVGRILWIDARDPETGFSLNLREDLLEELLSGSGPDGWDGAARLKKDVEAKAGPGGRKAGDGGRLLWEEAGRAMASWERPSPRGEALAWIRGRVEAVCASPPDFSAGAKTEKGRREPWVVLPLDKDCLRPAKTEYPKVLERLGEAVRRSFAEDVRVVVPVVLTSVEASGPGIPVEAVVRPSLLRPLAVRARRPEASGGGWTRVLPDDVRVRSLALEVGDGEARLRMVVSRPEPATLDAILSAEKALVSAKTRRAALDSPATAKPSGKAEAAKPPKAPKPLEERRAAADEAVEAARARLSDLEGRWSALLGSCCSVAGLDPGVREALASAAVAIPEGRVVDAALVRRLHEGKGEDGKALGKASVKSFLESRSLPSPVVVSSGSWSGKAFLRMLAGRCARIDEVSSRLDKGYEALAAEKAELNAALGRGPKAFVPVFLREVEGFGDAGGRGVKRTDPDGRRIVALFRKVRARLDRLAELKAERLALWGRIAASKDAWFGMMANAIAARALRDKSLVVIEDGDWGVEERGDESYKGRTWNRVMARVSRAGLLRRVEDRLDWLSVPRCRAPAAWSSSWDHRTGVVDKAQRPGGGKVFRAHSDGLEQDADLHAGESLAAMVLASPLDAEGIARRVRIEEGAKSKGRSGGGGGRRGGRTKKEPVPVVPAGMTERDTDSRAPRRRSASAVQV